MNTEKIKALDGASNSAVFITFLIGGLTAYLFPYWTWLTFLLGSAGSLVFLFLYAREEIPITDPQILKAPNTIISTGMVMMTIGLLLGAITFMNDLEVNGFNMKMGIRAAGVIFESFFTSALGMRLANTLENSEEIPNGVGSAGGGGGGVYGNANFTMIQEEIEELAASLKSVRDSFDPIRHHARDIEELARRLSALNRLIQDIEPWLQTPRPGQRSPR